MEEDCFETNGEIFRHFTTQSKSSNDKNNKTKVDLTGQVCMYESSKHSSFAQLVKSIFLPDGYPESVSKDYTAYQIWDTIQAFCSSINGTLATHAVLQSVGVGDEKATALAATMTWMLRDGVGMVGRIVFAWKKGSTLDANAKVWRLAADVLNDLAMFMELLSPLLPGCFLLVACLSSLFRSIVGVCGGATRAAMTQHQARRNNMGDVSAKDGSQETLVGLAALLVSIVVTPLIVESLFSVWILFCFFTFLHLYANYRAVTSVVFENFNRQRLQICLWEYLENNKILTPEQTAGREKLLYREPFNIQLGQQLQAIITSEQQKWSRKSKFFLSFLKQNKFCISFEAKHKKSSIILLDTSTQYNQLQAFSVALIIDYISIRKKRLSSDVLTNLGIELSENEVNADEQKLQSYLKITNNFLELCRNQNWDLEKCTLLPTEWRVSFVNKVKDD